MSKSMSKNIIIIDYKLGNLFSVKQACEKIGLNAIVSSEKEEIDLADALILPGVGAFGEAMDHLKDLELIDPIKKHVSSGKPLLGICLGLQLLFTESVEYGVSKGLDIIPGVVKKISNNDNGKKRLVPQIGWNQVHNSSSDWNKTPLRNISEKEYFYFVHSYYVEPHNEEHILGTTEYDGLKYCSVASNGDNVFATQFHPEKSAHKGLDIYKNWASMFNLI